MRLLLHLREEGKAVVKLNPDADIRAHRIRTALDDSGADVLYIEDLDRLGQGLARTLGDIRESRPTLLVVGTIRSPRFDGLGVASYVENRDDAMDVVAPLLTDDDIDDLLDTLQSRKPGWGTEGKTEVRATCDLRRQVRQTAPGRDDRGNVRPAL